MTLILSAICKNGICVCADRLSKKANSATDDNFNKLYRFKKIPLIIFNHGVNKFNNKMWDEFCAEYEKSPRWENLNLNDLSNDFRSFIEDDIKKELIKNSNINFSEEFLNSAFMYCGKGYHNTINKIIEFYWKYEDGELKFERKRFSCGDLIPSGSGKKYLLDYIRKTYPYYDNEYWKNIDVIQTKNELEKFFLVAVKEKNRVGGNEFSNKYDFEYILDEPIE